MPRTPCSRSRRHSLTMGMPKQNDLPDPVPVATMALVDWGFEIGDWGSGRPRIAQIVSDWCL